MVNIEAGLERLAELACSGRSYTADLAQEVLAAIAEPLSAAAIAVVRESSGVYAIEQVSDRAGIGLVSGDELVMHDQHFRVPGGGPGTAHFESLILGGPGGVRGCIAVPLYRPEGEAWGRLIVLPEGARRITPAEVALLRVAGSIITEALAMPRSPGRTAASDDAPPDTSAGQTREAERWKHRALHDALTGLPNRLLLQDRLQQAVHLAGRNSTPLAVLVVDLDNFKGVNDTYGHLAGDMLLQEVGHRMQQALRESDTVARLGGDEFVALLPEVDAAGARRVATKILRVLRRPYTGALEGCVAWASIGIAVYPEHGREASELFAAADAAMYQVKGVEGGYRVATAAGVARHGHLA